MKSDLIQMYFNDQVSRDFAEHEQNEKNFTVASIMDAAIVHETWSNISSTFKAVELWWWAHPDRYHEFFKQLITQWWSIDRVDISPFMLKLAKEYIDTKEFNQRLDVIHFVEDDIIWYLTKQEDKSIDLAIMKYTIDHIEDLDELFNLLKVKLKVWGRMISIIWMLSPIVKSHSTNARFLVNGEQFPDDETRTLKDGDTFTIKFFAESGNPNWGHISWAETTKYFQSKERIESLALKHWYDYFLWSHKDLFETTIMLDQNILVLRNN